MVISTNPVNVSLQVTQRRHRPLAPRATYQSAEAPVEWTAATTTPPPRRPLAALQLISVRPPVAPGALLLWTTRATWLVSSPQRSWPLSPVLEPAVQRQAPPSKEMWVMFAKKKKKKEWREAVGPLQCERNCSDHYEMASLMKVGQQRTEKFLAFEIIIILFPCFLFLWI